ncbi:hypothetical protein LTR86_011314, partial [Recurvomyces mirabilis]
IASCLTLTKELSAVIRPKDGHVIRIDPKAANKRVGQILTLDVQVLADEFGQAVFFEDRSCSSRRTKISGHVLRSVLIFEGQVRMKRSNAPPDRAAD